MRQPFLFMLGDVDEAAVRKTPERNQPIPVSCKQKDSQKPVASRRPKHGESMLICGTGCDITAVAYESLQIFPPAG